MKKTFLLAALFVFAMPAAAQRTVVTGTVTDGQAVPYSGASLIVTLTLPLGASGATLNGVQVQGTVGPLLLDATGSFLLQLPDNNVLLPAATKWTFAVTESPGVIPPVGTGPQTCSATLTITGVSQSVSSSLNACPSLTHLGAGGSLSAGVGGINSQTINYSAVTADNGKLIVMNGASLTVTLPNPPPSALWNTSILNLNSTPATISRNGLNINGVAADTVLFGQFTGLTVYTDGSNYFTNPTYGSAVLLNPPSHPVNQVMNIGVGNYSIQDSGAFTDFLDNGAAGTLALGRTAATHTLLGGWVSGGTQTISGCALTVAAGGTNAGKFASGTTGTCTVTITFPAAPTGWTCDAHDLTTPADANNVVQTAFTTTTATMSGTTVSGDVITWKCEGF